MKYFLTKTLQYTDLSAKEPALKGLINPLLLSEPQIMNDFVDHILEKERFFMRTELDFLSYCFGTLLAPKQKFLLYDGNGERSISLFRDKIYLGVTFVKGKNYDDSWHKKYKGLVLPEAYLVSKAKEKTADCFELTMLLYHFIKTALTKMPYQDTELYFKINKDHLHFSLVVKIGKKWFELNSNDEGHSIVFLNKYSNRLDVINEVVEKDLREVLLYWNIQHAVILAIQNEEFLPFYNAVLAQQPDNKAAIYNKARSLYAVQDYYGAVQTLNDAIKINGNFYRFANLKKVFFDKIVADIEWRYYTEDLTFPDDELNAVLRVCSLELISDYSSNNILRDIRHILTILAKFKITDEERLRITSLLAGEK